MIDIESPEFFEALAQYVQENGHTLYSNDKQTWTRTSSGTEAFTAMVVRVRNIECRHIGGKTYIQGEEFRCNICNKTLKVREYR